MMISNEPHSANEEHTPVVVTYGKGSAGVRMNIFRFDENGEEQERIPVRGEGYDEAAAIVDDAVSELQAKVYSTVAPSEVRMSGAATDQMNEVMIELSAEKLAKLRELSSQYAKELRAKLLKRSNSYGKTQWARWTERAAAEVLDDEELAKAYPGLHNKKVYLRAAEIVRDELPENDPDRQKLLDFFEASAGHMG